MENLEKDFDFVLRSYFGCDSDTADTKEIYNAVSKAVMLDIYKDWKADRESEGKRCGYMSAEFLVGRMIYANLLNLGLSDEVRELLEKRGLNINMFEEVDDAALGNGGLGRLAACYLESGATEGINLDGYGLRYRYGLFKQTFKDGFQSEEGDCWLKWGDPWSIRKEREAVEVTFSDETVLAIPYDMPVIGYKNRKINTLRLWQSEAVKPFDFGLFNDMQTDKLSIEAYKALKITDVLYPNDGTYEGKMLRLRQQYFLASATLQDILRRYKKTGKPLEELDSFICLQLNDTHPVIAIPELLRLLQNEGMDFDSALALCNKIFNFTNHTIMSEALEKWDERSVHDLLPQIWEQIVKLQVKIEQDNLDRNRYFIIRDGVIHMANLAIYVAAKVNGVAKIHTEILKTNTFRDWYELFPDKFENVTNGVTPRRWLMLNNPRLCEEITKRIGGGWKKDLTKLSEMKKYAHDPEFISVFKEIRGENKRRLAAEIKKTEGVEIPENFIFDIQVKRLHEYKRQLLNAFSILYIYYELKDRNLPDFKPTAFIFGAKAAPGYYNAKAIIKFINEIAKKVNADEETNDRLRVVFVQNYNVSYAEKIVCAADVSEQISMAGMEASGTGNMKFMMNGTVTLGTLDGANVEICEEAGKENNYIFGASVEEVARVKQCYNPKALYDNNQKIKRVVDSLVNGTFNDNNSGMLSNIYNSLVTYNNPDVYLVLYDFESYVNEKLKLNSEFGSDEFYSKSIENMAHSGKFSSDRSVRDYVNNIWHI